MLDTFGQDNPISFREEVANVQWTKLDKKNRFDISNVELLIYFQMITAKREDMIILTISFQVPVPRPELGYCFLTTSSVIVSPQN